VNGLALYVLHEVAATLAAALITVVLIGWIYGA
jgi:hypothetical protein